MKKFLVVVTIISILLISSFSSTMAVKLQTNRTMPPQTWIVDNEGDGDFKSIQCAVNQANSGDTINVYSGTYKERVRVNKKLTLIGIPYELDTGYDIGKPVVDGRCKGNVIEIYADGCTVSCFEIINAGYLRTEGNGLFVASSNNHTISNNTFKNNFMGLFFGRDRLSKFLKIKNFPINCTVEGNDFQFNVFGMYFIRMKDHNIVNNSCQNSGIIFGDTPCNVLSCVFLNNLVNGKPVYLHLNEENTVISHPDAGQLIILDCHNCIIENMTIHNTSIGIIISHSSNLVIRNNTFENIHRGGISLHGNNSEAYNNTFRNCSYGCYLEGGINFYIHHNNFIKCFKHDQPVFSYKKKYQKFAESKNICYDSNYWDDWIGLKISFMRWMPKIIFGFRKSIHKELNIFPIFKFDRHPALEPY